MKPILPFIVSIITIATLQISCNPAQQKQQPRPASADKKNIVQLTPAQYQTADIQIGPVEKRELSALIKANGTLEVPPQNRVSITAPFGGFLRSSNLLQGSHVKKGQVIAVMENPEYIQLQQDYLESKSQLHYLEAEYQRQEALARENINARKALQKAQSDYQSMKARTSGLQAKLQMLNISAASLEKGIIQSRIFLYSPISGYVTQANANIGTFVNTTDVLFRIVNTDHLHAELIVYEKDVPKIKPGQKVRFTLANETKERMGTVFLTGKEISAERTLRVHCHLQQEDSQLIPGLYLKAFIETGGNKVNALPDQAIITFDGQKFIFIAEEDRQQKGGDHRFRMLAVSTGISAMGYTEVRLPKEFNTNTVQVVVKGAYSLLSQIKNTEETPE